MCLTFSIQNWFSAIDYWRWVYSSANVESPYEMSSCITCTFIRMKKMFSRNVNVWFTRTRTHFLLPNVFSCHFLSPRFDQKWFVCRRHIQRMQFSNSFTQCHAVVSQLEHAHTYKLHCRSYIWFSLHKIGNAQFSFHICSKCRYLCSSLK